MPELPTLAPTSTCPDPHCRVPVGEKHAPDCEVATCLATGQQRILHQDDMPDAPIGIDPSVIEMLTHDCGEDTWTGQRHGIAECQEYGWFVRRPTATDPTGATWMPCTAEDPGATPDLDRLTRHATWHPAQQRWIRREEVPGRG